MTAKQRKRPPLQCLDYLNITTEENWTEKSSASYDSYNAIKIENMQPILTAKCVYNLESSMKE